MAQQNVHFTGDFESGRIEASSSNKDGFYIHTLAHPQIGTESVRSSLGGFGPETGLDTRVVTSEIVGSEIVLPRNGKFFLRSALYFGKDYSELNSGLNKPRSKFPMSHENNRYDFDVEGYVGFSIYLPKNFEHETGTKDSRGSVMFYQGITQSASYTNWTLRVYVPGGNVAHWIPYVNVNDKSVKSGGKKEFDIGPVTEDLGKWTDFVVRYRFNPFSVKTNPAKAGIPSAKDQVYEGNKGIFQMWKSVGNVDGNGNRQMKLVIDMENEPVGIVPHATVKLVHQFKVYKYGWHVNPTDVAGPIWIGVDEFRDGRVLEDGTRYSDVHPGLACADHCVGPGETRPPLPPADLIIVQ
jgi:hypothetical protein